MQRSKLSMQEWNRKQWLTTASQSEITLLRCKQYGMDKEETRPSDATGNQECYNLT